MSTKPTPAVEDPIGLDPTEAELEEWVERERKRRAAWLAGPTPEERAAYAERERARRRGDLSGEERAAELSRMMRKYPREAQLAAEGAMSLVLHWSRHMYGELVRAGREWESEVSEPSQRRRVPIDDDQA